MVGQIVEFIATGTPRALSQAIEEDARGRGAVSVLVVPWESDDVTLSMAITLVKSDGWAIEHTNLGTLTLTDLGHNRTQVAVVAHQTDRSEHERIAPVLDAFSRQIQGRFQAGASGAAHAP
ncbi:MAG: hypothetical protein ACRD2N_15415 [Vicinamibacterales bacterium]